MEPKKEKTMGKHSVKVRPGTPTHGATARFLLQQPFVKQTTLKCPLCNTPIPIQDTLESQIRALAAHLGEILLMSRMK